MILKKISSLTIIEVLVSSLLVMMSYLFLIAIYINIHKPDHGIDKIITYYKIKSVKDSIMHQDYRSIEVDESQELETEIQPFKYDSKASKVTVTYAVSGRSIFVWRYIKY